MVKHATVDVVIPHYGSDEILKDCLGSMEGAALVERIFLINNNENNLGFSIGVNKGLVDSLNLTDAKYVAIVNNDTKFLYGENSPFEYLVDFMDNHKDTAIISPRIVSDKNHDQIVHGGTVQCFPNGVHKTGLISLGQLNTWTYEKWVSFAVVLIRKEALLEVGLLDKNMFLICSDSDWCYRARYFGWKCAYCPGETWSHVMGESSKPSSDTTYKIMRKDSYHFFKKWIEPGGLFTELDKEIL